MNILITGSSGEIGTNLSIKLIELGHKVLGIDKRKNTWSKKIPTTICDLSESFMNKIKFKPDILIHLAANAKVYEIVTDPRKALDNIIVTFNALEYSRKKNIPIIFSSSREVYGDIHRYITNETHGDFHFTESPYSASKISGEAFIYSYKKCYNIPYIIYRFSNVYGRYDSDIDRMERVVPLFIKKIKHNEPITIYGRNKLLDFTYIDDCVDGIISGINKLLDNKIKSDTFNLAYGKGHSLIELAEIIGKELMVEPSIDFQNSRLGEVTHYVADISKSKNILGFSPKVNLSKGISNAIKWHKKYYNW